MRSNVRIWPGCDAQDTVNTTAGRIPALSLTPGAPEAGDVPASQEPLVVQLDGAGNLGARIQSDPALEGTGDAAEVIDLDQVDVVDVHVEVPPADTGGLLIGLGSTQLPGLTGPNMD